MKSIVIAATLIWCIWFVVAEGKVLGELEPERYIPIGDKALKLSTIAHSTSSFFKAIKHHDFVNALKHVNKYSIFVIHSLLPGSGSYQGRSGFIKMNKSWMQTVHITDFDCTTLLVDEARGKSLVECRSSGVFRHNGASFENSKVKIFIKWSLGKIEKFNIVEMDADKMYHLFQTVAEKRWLKIMEAMYRCGGCEDFSKYIAEDIVVNLNVSPLSLVTDAAHEERGDKEQNVALKGRSNLLKLADFADKTYLDVTDKIKILYSDNTTVVAAKMLIPHRVSNAIADKKMYMKYVTIMYTINRFDEQGLLKEVDLILNRPITPWQLRKMDQLLLLYSNTTLNNLLAPLKKIVTVSGATPERLSVLPPTVPSTPTTSTPTTATATATPSVPPKGQK